MRFETNRALFFLFSSPYYPRTTDCECPIALFTAIMSLGFVSLAPRAVCIVFLNAVEWKTVSTFNVPFISRLKFLTYKLACRWGVPEEEKGNGCLLF